MAKMFISQDLLDTWSAEQRLMVNEQVLQFSDGRQFFMRPAVLFLSVSGGEVDPNQLLGTVQEETDLRQLGADQYMNSVILGEVAYEVRSGFLCEAAVG